MTQAADSYFQAPPQPAGWPKNIDPETIGYRCSKTAMRMLMLDWNHELGGNGVKVLRVSPGFCATGLSGLGPELREAMGAEPPSEGGHRLIAVAEDRRDAGVGKIIEQGRVATMMKKSCRAKPHARPRWTISFHAMDDLIPRAGSEHFCAIPTQVSRCEGARTW